MNGLSTTEELVDRHANLAARGMFNCRAAQALKKEITRRRLETQRAFLANDSDHYNPEEHRDHGKWTAGPNVAGSPKNSPANTPPKPAFQLIPETPFIGTAADYMASHPDASPQYFGSHEGEPARLPTKAEIGQVFGTIGQMFGNTGRALSAGLADFGETITGNPTLENLSALSSGQPLPMWDEARFLPTPLRAIEKASQGLVESAPKIAAVAALQAAGVPAPAGAGLIFGTTEQGFDPKQAAIAAALPFLSEFGGEISASVAQRFNVSPGTAMNALKAAAASAAPAAGMLADQEHEISKLPPDQQKEARIEMWINLAGMALTGIHGDEFGGKPGETPVPREQPAGEVPSKPQAPEPSAAPKPPPQPLSAAERETLEQDIEARRPISADSISRANVSGGINIPKGYVIDFPNNRLVYAGTDNPLPAGSAPEKSPTPSPETQREDSDAGRLPSLQGNVPNPVKWRKNGGSIAYKPDGSMTYTSRKGVSVNYNPLGYPDLTPYLYTGSDGKAAVSIDVTGDRGRDADAANAAAGFSKTPPGYTWHHNENVGLMQLIDEDVHADFFHSGGVSVFKKSNQ